MIYHYLVFKNNAVQSTTTQICTSAVHCIGQCITWLGCIAPQAVHSIGQCIALSSWCIAGCDRGEHEVGELPAANSTQLNSTPLDFTKLHTTPHGPTQLYFTLLTQLIAHTTPQLHSQNSAALKLHFTQIHTTPQPHSHNSQVTAPLQPTLLTQRHSTSQLFQTVHSIALPPTILQYIVWQ